MLVFIEPTARLTMSNCLGSDEGSIFSILLLMTWMFFSPNFPVAFSKNADFFVLLSTNITVFSGFAIAIGMPGNPPPLPKSTRHLCNFEDMASESWMCSFRKVVWLLDIRL